MKTCPTCQERLNDDAIQCTHCGHQFAPFPAAPRSPFRPTPNARKFGCAILIIAVLALLLWALTSRYFRASPEAANAVNASGNSGGNEQAR